MVDVFDRHEVRFDPRLAGCSKFVRHSDYAALEAQLAETQEKLIAANNKLIQKNEAQADYERRILSALEPAARATSTVDSHETANVREKPAVPEECGSCGYTADPDCPICSPAPEAQQEPVATGQHVAYFDDGQFHWMSGIAPRNCELYTRPSEQAVTEAAGPFITFANHAVEKTDDGWVWRTSSNERICDWFGPSDFAALKAAMEAGR